MKTPCDNNRLNSLLRRMAARNSGDRNLAWKEFHNNWHTPLYAFFYELTHSCDDADDLTQELYIRLDRRLRNPEPINRPCSYIWSMAWKIFYTYCKVKSKRSEDPLDEFELDKSERLARRYMNLTENADPIRDDIIRRGFARLKTHYQEILILRGLGVCTITSAQAARFLSRGGKQITINDVDVRKHKAVKNLASIVRELEEEEFEDLMNIYNTKHPDRDDKIEQYIRQEMSDEEMREFFQEVLISGRLGEELCAQIIIDQQDRDDELLLAGLLMSEENCRKLIDELAKKSESSGPKEGGLQLPHWKAKHFLMVTGGALLIMACVLLFFFGVPVGNDESVHKFKITSYKYDEDMNLDSCVKAELGNEFTVADWNDIKQYCDQHSAAELIDAMQWNMKPEADSASSMHLLVLWNGTKVLAHNPKRYFFAVRFDHQVPEGFGVHDQIDNHRLVLGSWMGMRHKILAVRK